MIIAHCGKRPGLYMGGSVIAFVKAIVPLGLLSLGVMLVISTFIIATPKTPVQYGVLPGNV